MNKKRLMGAFILLVGIAAGDVVLQRYEPAFLLALAPEGIVIIGLVLFLVLIALKARQMHYQNDGTSDIDNRKFWLSIRRIYAAMAAFFFPCDGCRRCWMPWAISKAHITPVNGLFGAKRNEVFALCEPCFRELRPDERLEFYVMNFSRLLVRGAVMRYETDDKGQTHNIDWCLIYKAVLREGKVEEQSGEQKVA